MTDARRVAAAVVTAGGRLTGAMAAEAGTPVKALAPLGGRPLIHRILDALAAVPGVGEPVIVGPVDDLSPAVADRTARLVAEGETGPENVRRALAALAPDEKRLPVLLCTSDLAFVTPDAVAWLLDNPPADAEIVYPVIGREAYDAAFPGSPNTYAKLAGREYTGGSVLLVRADAIERNLPLIERVFDARKDQLRMARLLGLPFLLRFVFGTLSIAHAEARASALTGCRCRALVGAPPEIAADIDSAADYDFARRLDAARLPGQSNETGVPS